MKQIVLATGLGIALLLLIVLELISGPANISLAEVGRAMVDETSPFHAIIWRLRFPRMLYAICVGAGLALCGLSLQGLFRNPLADPFTLGISGGAAFGASLVAVTGVSSSGLAISAAAFAGALLSCLIVYLMAERALSRTTKGTLLADKQMVQEHLAESYIAIQQFRQFVLYTAARIDRYNDYKKVRRDIAAIKVMTPRVVEDVSRRAIQVHGALGMTTDMPLMRMLTTGIMLALADGPTEVHQTTVARQLLRGYQGTDEPWPSSHLPTRRATARKALFGDDG